jgi:hypothetical protein
MQPQPLPARHVSDWQYANFDQAKAAGLALAGHLLKREQLDTACLVHCALTVATFGVSVALPHEPDGPIFAKKSGKAKPPTTDKAMGKALEEAFAPKSAAAAAPAGDLWDWIPWDILLPMLLSLIERFLRKGK